MIEDLQKQLADARVGKTLRGKWILEELLGIGGMAAVYRARHRNGAKVAVKILHPVLGESAEIRRRFAHEGYVANKIDHPAVVRVHDDDTDDDGLPFFVMDLVEGETLAAKVQDHYFGDDEILEVAEQVCGALAAAHAAGVVHRDLKPDNLLVEGNGKIRVLDFGIARLLEEGSDGTSPFSTRTGIAFGTPGFAAPEQALGKRREIGPQTDLFALGATLFYLATGEFLHAAETPQELLVLVATQPARLLHDLAPHISPEVAALVDRATRLAISDRWPSASAMLAAVRRVRRMSVPVARENTLFPPAPLDSTDRAMAIETMAIEDSFARPSLVPTRPSISRMQRRKRSYIGVATAIVLVVAASFMVTSTRAQEPVAHVAAAEVVTETLAVTDQAPPPELAPVRVADLEAAPPRVVPASAPKTKPSTSADSTAKMFQKLADKTKKIDLGY